MKIKNLSVWHLNIPLKISFKHALAERKTSTSVLVKLTLDNDVYGYGESLPRKYVTGETVESCSDAITKVLFPYLKDIEFNSYEDIKKVFISLNDKDESTLNLTALCAVELALIDALCRTYGKDIYSFIGINPKTSSITYSMIVSADNIEQVKKYTKRAKRFGIKNLKLKVTDNLDYNEEMLKAVVEIYPKAIVRVDANCAWDLDNAIKNLDMLQKYDIKSCEQALVSEDMIGFAELVNRYPDILICLDESLCSYKNARDFTQNNAVSSFNIRISKNGGFSNAYRIYQLAKENSVVCQLGAQVGETAILSSFGRVFAGITGDLCFHEGSFGDLLLETDITPIKYRFGFRGKASTRIKGVGTGIPIDENIIEANSDIRIDV